jgi:hypothetical protein
MQPLDLLVGGVAIAFGLALLAGTILDGPWLMSLAKPRLLADAIGRPAARVLLAIVGVGLIVLGVAVARGWRVNWGGQAAGHLPPEAVQSPHNG